MKGLLELLVKYRLNKFHAKYERSIDELTIKRGLGWQELAFADFMENKSMATSQYKLFLKVNYLSSSEIESEISKLKMYSSVLHPKKRINSVIDK